jgi:F420-0:gamma-glutamyl ligase
MSAVILSPEQEQQAQTLAARIHEAVDGDILELARLLVSKPEHEVFGQTEFEVRDLVHQLGATALQTHLAEKKTATGAAALSAPAADRPRSSKTIGPKSR